MIFAEFFFNMNDEWQMRLITNVSLLNTDQFMFPLRGMLGAGIWGEEVCGPGRSFKPREGAEQVWL